MYIASAVYVSGEHKKKRADGVEKLKACVRRAPAVELVHNV
jgi:hypothetical protein